MRTDSVQTLPKTFARQEKLYEAADQSADMTIELPFAVNFETLLNTAALAELAIDVQGLARQMDQIYVENIGNNWASRIKTAVKNQQPLPVQEDLDALVLAYDFSGARTTSEESMSSDDKILLSELRKYCRQAFVRDAVFNKDGGFFVSRIETQKEATARAKALVKVETGEELEEGETAVIPNGTLELAEFDAFVQAAFDKVPVQVTDAVGESWDIDFSQDVWQDWLQQPKNEAAALIEKRKTGSVAPAPLPLDDAEAA